MGRVRFGVGTLWLAAAFACSGSAGEPPLARADAGAEAPDGAPRDAGAEDAREAGGDAADAGADASSCGYDFCEDFDGPLYFSKDRWQRSYVGGAGRLSVENGALVSELLELDAFIFSPATLDLERNWVVSSAPGTKRTTTKMRAKLDTCPKSGFQVYTLLGGVDRAPGYGYTVSLILGTSGIDCGAWLMAFTTDADGGAVYPSSEPIFIATGSFVDYDLEVAETSGTVSMKLAVGTQNKTVTFPSTSIGDVMTVGVGIVRSWSTLDPVYVTIDDIRLDYGR